jgi:valyl-tRNA synthetase
MKEPDNKEVKYYYPTQDLVTAPEIMFFWVARMIMAGYAFRGEKPFSNVYYHGIVRDKQRRKMSKSLGNSPDPLDLIATFGADGTRVGMLFSAPAGNDLLFDEALCEQGRNFSNKIWNAFRFLAMNMEEGREYKPALTIDRDNLADRWMMARVQQTIAAMNDDFDKYRLNDALQKIYSLVWDDFCDWYIELCKADEYGQKFPAEKLERALGFFEVLMKLLHPFMPFITEEIWQFIQPRTKDEALTISEWPEAEGDANKDDLQSFASIQQVISAVRNIRAEMNVSPKTALSIYIKPADQKMASILNAHSWIIKKMLPVEELNVDINLEKPKAAASAVVEGSEIFIPLAGVIDLDKEKERITKEIKRLEGFLKGINAKLSNDRFVNSAPADVVEKERKKQADASDSLEKQKVLLAEIEG